MEYKLVWSLLLNTKNNMKTESCYAVINKSQHQKYLSDSRGVLLVFSRLFFLEERSLASKNWDRRERTITFVKTFLILFVWILPKILQRTLSSPTKTFYDLIWAIKVYRLEYGIQDTIRVF